MAWNTHEQCRRYFGYSITTFCSSRVEICCHDKGIQLNAKMLSTKSKLESLSRTFTFAITSRHFVRKLAKIKTLLKFWIKITAKFDTCGRYKSM